jgi:low temperature requirement protein LtrA
VIAGGVVLVFSLWWLYFSREDADVLERRSVAGTMAWGFGHYFIFAATAAVGAGLGARVDFYIHHSAVGHLATALCITVPVAVIVAAVYAIHIRPHDPGERTKLAFLATAVVVLLGSFTPVPEPVAGLACALLVVACVVGADEPKEEPA